MKRNGRRPRGVCQGLRVFAVSLMVAFLLCSIHVVEGAAQEESYEKDFAWTYKGRHWTWSLSIPHAVYTDYKGVPVQFRTWRGIGGYGFLTTTHDAYVRLVAEKLRDAAASQGYDTYDTVSFVLAFVQSLPYTSDSETSGYDEYPRFPIETLVDGGGDCEDTSILFATITLLLNFDTVYIIPPEHVAVGIWGTNLPGVSYTYKDRTYYYCETTGEGFAIGEIPTAHRGQKAIIYAIALWEQYTPTLASLLKALIVIVGVGAGAAAVVVYRQRRRRQRTI
jgi:hypothetical protein